MNANRFNVKELTDTELKNINGGGFWLWLLTGLAYDIISDPGALPRGWKAGAAAAQN